MCQWDKCGFVAKPPHAVRCTQCDHVWCCMECCIEDDNLDHQYFDMIYEFGDDLMPEEVVHPEYFDIVCCDCSGKPRSYEDRPED